MKKPIGKLLWHKAVRKTATFTPDDRGEILLEIPVIFNEPVWRHLYTSVIEKKLIKAIKTHLTKTHPHVPAPDGYTAAFSITWKAGESSDQKSIIFCSIKTTRLIDWKWLANYNFKKDERNY